MKPLRDHFQPAAWDYLYLLDRSYPQKALIKLIGDRYRLSGTERSMLYRGICASGLAHERRSKLATTGMIRNNPVAIDTYNVLITIGSYLNGNAVFISNDHFVRDASEIHGKAIRATLLQRSVNLLFDFFLAHKPSGIHFFLDSSVSNSGMLAQKLNEILNQNQLHGTADTHRSPDHLLKATTKGLIATSDSTIIEKTGLKVIDLPQQVLCSCFEPDFFDLSSFVHENQ